MWPVVVLGGELILLLFTLGVVVAGCWSELRGGCFWEVYNTKMKSIGDIWFSCSQAVDCFSEGLLREVLLYLKYMYTTM